MLAPAGAWAVAATAAALQIHVAVLGECVGDHRIVGDDLGVLPRQGEPLRPLAIGAQDEIEIKTCKQCIR